jgi:hypothetical protein
MYRPTSVLSPVLVCLYLLGVPLALVAVWSDWQEVQLLQAAQAGGDIREDRAEALDQWQQVIGTVQLAFGLEWLLFLIWVYQSNGNTWAFGVPDLRFTPGWSVGWFFVPVMNLFRPYQVVKEVWAASHPGPEPWDPRPAPVAIAAWWSNRVVALAAGRAAVRLTARAKTLPEHLTASQVQLVADLVDLPLMLLSAWLVWSIFQRQQAKYHWFLERAMLNEPKE